MKKSERIASVITSLAGVMVMAYAWGVLNLGTIHVPDAGLLPFLCGAGLTVLGVLWMFTLEAAKEKDGAEAAGKQLRYRPWLSLALMVLYAWALEAVGYFTSTLFFMIVWQQVVEREKWIKTIVIALLGTAAMYSLFSLFLKVPIPKEFFLK